MSEKYPEKRSWARPKLQKFLKEEGLYKAFVNNCKIRGTGRSNKCLAEAFSWRESEEGYDFWLNVLHKFIGIK